MTTTTTEPISKEIRQKMIQRMMQPKIWIHTEKSGHRFAHSSRCIYCMSIKHKSEKCPST
jgi:hypothetical protein